MPEEAFQRERRSFFNRRFAKTERRRKNKRWAAILVLSIPLFFVFEETILSAGIITDISMLPTLKEGRYFVVHKYPYLFRTPRRGDIVVLRPPKNHRWRYVKRVIGVEGETLRISKGRVLVEDRPLKEPYTLGLTLPDMEPLVIPKGHYFVLGDNRENSEDSRIFGCVPRENIEGEIFAGLFVGNKPD